MLCSASCRLKSHNLEKHTVVRLYLDIINSGSRICNLSYIICVLNTSFKTTIQEYILLRVVVTSWDIFRCRVAMLPP
jgi:hypothetical protein